MDNSDPVLLPRGKRVQVKRFQSTDCLASIWLILCLLCPLAGPAALFRDGGFTGAIRVRGFYQDTRLLSGSEPAADATPSSERGSDFYARERLRLGGWIEPMDDVVGRLTLQVKGIQNRKGRSDKITMGISEALLEFENIAFTPLSLKPGRQTAHFGDGLIISDKDGEWILDACRLRYDALPWTADVMYAAISHLAPDTPVNHFWWGQMLYEGRRSWLRRTAFYSGLFNLRGNGAPVLVGFREQVYRDPLWTIQAELGYEFGERYRKKSLSAFITDASIRRDFPTTVFTPHGRVRWTYASGSEEPGGPHEFIPLLNYDDWGVVLNPRLANIHILSLQGGINPLDNVQILLEAFTYWQEKSTGGVVGNTNFPDGAYPAPANGRNTSLGFELEVRIQVDFEEWLSLELLAARFEPGSAYDGVPDAGAASEVRVQLAAEF